MNVRAAEQYSLKLSASHCCNIFSYGLFLLLSSLSGQVYVLSRMGNSCAALRLIIRNQQDIPRAIEFVRLQRDEELWEELIDWALSSADTTGGWRVVTVGGSLVDCGWRWSGAPRR